MRFPEATGREKRRKKPSVARHGKDGAGARHASDRVWSADD